MNSKEVIEKYFDYFNSGNREGMFSLLHNDLNHEVNQGDTRKGLQLFRDFMNHMDICYKENLRDIVIMNSSTTNKRVSAEFIVDGIYIKTDKGLPEAKSQKYSVRAGSFFEVENGKITRVTTYYNLPQWIKAVQ